ncbi:MAG: hypothetical protein J0L76_12280 [Rhodobacterales bacterium]|nr:hypothetical protein [Rhodobacterales bacterium]
MARRVAVNVKNGAGRIPEEKLGRAARFVPSHLRVAAWIRNFGATLAHASATADPDVTRGNALVADIQRPLWDQPVPEPMPEPDPLPEPAVSTTPDTAPPVVLAEPTAPTHDPLAAIRDDLAGKPGQPAVSAPAGPASPPAPPGALAEGAIQVSGWLIGWASAIVALPYGFCRAIWLWLNGTDLKRIGTED